MSCGGCAPAFGYVGTGMPTWPAPPGTFFNDINGCVWVNVWGTAAGWFRFAIAPDDRDQWQTNEADGPFGGMFGDNAPNGIVNGSVLSAPWTLGGGTRRIYVSAYSGAAIGNSVVFRFSSVTRNRMVVGQMAQGAPQQDWDIVSYLRTTARPTNAAAATTLADSRIWFACPVGLVADMPGSPANSDVMRTAFPNNSGVVGTGSYGVALRYSAGVDAGWTIVTWNEVGGVLVQTDTPTGIAIAADTAYRVRLRYEQTGGPLGVPRVRAAINTSAWMDVTANVGPGVLAPGGMGLANYLSVTTKVALLKSLGWGKTALAVGGCS